jgi:hypothetical protein
MDEKPTGYDADEASGGWGALAMTLLLALFVLALAATVHSVVTTF